MIVSGEASSSNSARGRYDVFLSFRGEDTRTNFTDHLYHALVNAGFHTFRDDNEIRRCEDIQSELKYGIDNSNISIIVFSKDYASSRWCLDELLQIMERRMTDQHHVLPIFYGVDPTRVRKQTKGYAKAFARHEKRFDVDKLERWRKALRDVADLGGLVLENRYETELIQDIVMEIRKKLDRPVRFVTPYLVGREDLVNDINSWLEEPADDVGIASIFGIGGVGKSTVASIVYNMNLNSFQGSCFLADIKENSEQSKGLIGLQEQLLRDLLKVKEIKINNIDEGIMKIQAAVRNRRVLVVLDGLDDLNQYKAVIGMRSWFYPGSKIIITTRNEQLLKNHDGHEKFEVEKLNFDESIKLLCWHAFGQQDPAESYMECSKRLVEHCDGLPLALEVIGSSLSGKDPCEWGDTLDKLKKIMDGKVYSILMMGYNFLRDDHDKRLFLDVACFFVGMDKDYVCTILKGCGFYTIIGIRNLIDKNLIFVDLTNKIRMHPLLRDMAREIVRQESPEDLEKRSRLWNDKDSLNVLRGETGTEAVTGLCLDMQRLKDAQCKNNANVNNAERCSTESSCGLNQRRPDFFSWKSSQTSSRFPIPYSNEKRLRTSAFERMRRLRLLQINYVELVGTYREFPKSLVWLCWHGFPLESIPEDLCLDNLVTLEMPYSRLKHEWKCDKYLMALRVLDLSYCYGLVKTPDFMGLPSLERLILKECINLDEIDDSIVYLQKLLFLDLSGCRNLRKLSEKIGKLEYLQELDLSSCSELKELPLELGQLDSLKVLRLDGFAMNPSKCDAGDPKRLNDLWPQSWYSTLASWYSRKFSKPISFSLALASSSLVKLHAANCNLMDDAVAIDFSRMGSLEMLDLTGNKFCKLPESFSSLTKLSCLIVSGCRELQSLPELPMSLMFLGASRCVSLESIRNLPNNSKGLMFYFTGCEKLIEIQNLLKLKAMTNADREIINNLGLFKLESIEGPEFEMQDNLDFTVRKGPLQVLHEYGISSFFLLRNDIPDWYSYCSQDFVSFVVPRVIGRKISGLNVCIAFENNLLHHESPFYPLVSIINETKLDEWMYAPSFNGYPRNGQDLLWLSHWKLPDGTVEAGDYVTVFAGRGGRIKGEDGAIKCGVHIVYEAEDEGNRSEVRDEDLLRSTSLWRQPLQIENSSSVSGAKSLGVAVNNSFKLRHI